MRIIFNALLFMLIISGCSMPEERLKPVDRAETQTTEMKPLLKEPQEIPPVTPLPPEDAPLQAEVWLDCGNHRLGAYTIELNYDPAVVAIAEIKTAVDPSAFPGAPMANPATFKSGKTVILGLYTGDDIPVNKIKLAVLRFAPAAIGLSPLTVSIKSAYDTDGNPFSATISISPDSITVP